MAEEKADSTVGLMDPDSQEFTAMLAAMKAKSGTPKPTDETKDTPASSAEKGTKEEPKAETKAEKAEAKEEKPETDPVKLQAQVTGLKAELTRVRQQRQSPEEVAKLNDKLARLEGRLDQATKQPEKTQPPYTDEQLIQMQTDWEEVLASGDAEKVPQAKHQLNLIRTELHQRSIAGATAKGKSSAEQEELVKEATSLYEEALTLFPDLNDHESELWKASNAEYTKRPRFMKALGPYADAIAVSMAIAKNPKLVGNGTAVEQTKAGKEARKELLDNLEKTAEKALLKGSGTASTTPKFDFGTATATSIQDIADRIKRGETVSL